MTIVSAVIEKRRFQNEMVAVFEDGSESVVFSYYPDELHFHSSEVVGMTADEARQLFHKKDVAYLRS